MYICIQLNKYKYVKNKSNYGKRVGWDKSNPKNKRWIF